MGTDFMLRDITKMKQEVESLLGSKSAYKLGTERGYIFLHLRNTSIKLVGFIFIISPRAWALLKRTQLFQLSEVIRKLQSTVPEECIRLLLTTLAVG
jgi:hypothetical protein